MGMHNVLMQRDSSIDYLFWRRKENPCHLSETGASKGPATLAQILVNL
jgi:hypothetical protein